MRFNPHNCLLFVIDQFLQHPDGYVIIRRSDSGWFPHFLFSRNLKDFWEYTPIKRSNKRLWLPPPFYNGCVRHTTADNLKRNPFIYTKALGVEEFKKIKL